VVLAPLTFILLADAALVYLHAMEEKGLKRIERLMLKILPLVM